MPAARSQTSATRPVLVWNEGVLDGLNTAMQKLYPRGLQEALADPLRVAGLSVRTAALADPEQGLGAAALDSAAAVVVWAHASHRELRDETVARVIERARQGLGLVFLHSAHASPLFRAAVGAGGAIAGWDERGLPERLHVRRPGHPVARGVQEFTLEREEVYREPFDVPTDGEIVLESSFDGEAPFRSGIAWQRGRGRIFYFRPGHETFPTFHHPQVRAILANAVAWAGKLEPT